MAAPNPPTGLSPGMPPTAGSTAGRRMTDAEVLGIVQTEIDSSLGWTGTRLAEQRREAMAEYLGLPRGDEREGFSQVITREVFEQVEQLLPPLMEIFASSNKVVEFKPESADDVEGAKQATDAVNWVFRRENGFMALYTMMKDALIQKNGLVKVWWDEASEGNIETYEGKGFDEFAHLLDDPNYIIQQITALVVDPMTGEQTEYSAGEIPDEDAHNAVYDVTGVRVNRTGRVRIENIPPEEFFINRDARSLDHKDATCRFVGHRVRTNASRLKAEGFDPALVDHLPSAQSAYSTDQDGIIRASMDDSFPLNFSYRSDSERTIYVNECYVKIDRDGDGVSEWWKVTAGGEYGQALLGIEPADGHPFASLTPIPVPHRFYGLSLHDIVSDIQNRSTTLERQRFDALYLSIAPRNVVYAMGQDEDATPMVNLEQLYHAVPGSHIEEYEKGALRPYDQNTNMTDVVPSQELLRESMIHRTGVNPEAAAVQPEAISKHVYGAMVQQGAAQQRIGLYARIMADTGVQQIFWLIFKVLCQHQTREMMVRLRGKWETVDPTSWNHQMDCEVAVGLGRGSRMEQMQNLSALGNVMEKVIARGSTLVNEKHIHNLVSDMAENMGFRDPQRYIDDPEDPERPPPPEPEPDPAMVALEFQREHDMLKLELDRQKVEIERDKQMLELKKMELEHEAAILKIRAGKDNPLPEAPFDDPWQAILADAPLPAAMPMVPTEVMQ